MWRHPEFMKLWVGQTVSEIGTRVSREGLPLTAALLLNATPAEMGLLAALSGFAAFLAGPVAGVVADRWRHRPILVLADLGRAAVLGVVPLAAWQGWLSMPVLLGVVGAAGLLTVFFDVAYQSFLPSLVAEEQLMEGNSKLSMSAATAEIVGPAMTGFLVQSLTAPRAVLLDALSFLFSAACVLSIRRTAIRRAPSAAGEASWAEMTAGARLVWLNPILRALALRAATLFFFIGFFATLYVVYAVRELGLRPAVLGIVIALGGVSAMAGASITPRMLGWAPLGRVLIGSTIISGMTLLLMPLARGPVMGAICLGAAQLLGDLFYPVYYIHEITLRQKVTPPDRLGRVNACMQLVSKGVLPVGSLLGGGLASWVGMRPTLVACAMGVMASALWLVWSPVAKLVDFPSREEAV